MNNKVENQIQTMLFVSLKMMDMVVLFIILNRDLILPDYLNLGSLWMAYRD